jgi:hypothetical protein
METLADAVEYSDEYILGGVNKTYYSALTRNSTSFPKKLAVRLHELHHNWKKDQSENNLAKALKYYQWLVVKWMTEPGFGVSDARGLLIYHSMGMGKTRLAFAVAFCLIQMAGIMPVLIFPKSLHHNMLDTIAQVMKILNPDVSDDEIKAMQNNFSFISADAYNMSEQLAKLAPVGVSPLEKRIVIIDEAHNPLRAIVNSTNDETNARKLYNTIMGTKDLKILFLTGSPVVKNVFEIVPLFNMIAGKVILPIQYDLFTDTFVDMKEKRIKNRDVLKNRLLGIVSFVNSSLPTEPIEDNSDIVQLRPRDDNYFPELLPTKIEKIEMSKEQYKRYLLAREKEDMELSSKTYRSTHKTALSLPSSEMGRGMSTYYVRSRMISNFAPPAAYENIPVADMPDEVFNEKTSPKLTAISKLIIEQKGSTIGYSQFIDNGLVALGRFLQKLGLNELKLRQKKLPTKTKKDKLKEKKITRTEEELDEELEEKQQKHIGGNKRPNKIKDKDDKIEISQESDVMDDTSKYALLTGRVEPDDRKKIQDIFNKEQNKLGELLKFLGFSSTGAEGLDLKNPQAFYGMEPYWYMSRIIQAIARGNRLGSHNMLPRELRQIQPYLFLSVANKEIYDSIPAGQYKETQTIDEKFYERARDQEILLNDMRQILREISIECVVNGYGNCHMCAPTDKLLFHDDIKTDLNIPNPCTETQESEIEAQELNYGKNKYYYRKLPNGNFEFYQYDSELGAYINMAPDDPVIEELEKIIKS